MPTALGLRALGRDAFIMTADRLQTLWRIYAPADNLAKAAQSS